MGKKNLSWVTPSGCIKKKLAVFFFFLAVNVISKWWLSRLVLHNSHGPWESHLFQLVQHEYTTWSMSQYLIHILRVPKERTLAPSRSLYPVTTWSSELHLSLMVRHLKVQLLACLMKLYICNQTDQPFFPLKKKKNLLSRSVLDGCPGAGSELLQPLQADGQSWERRRYQHDFRVLPYTEPAAVHGTHWYRAAAVSHKLTQLDPRTYDWFQSFFYNLLLLDHRWFLYSRFA